MVEQFVPVASQRSHAYWNEAPLAPAHWPGDACTWFPGATVPTITGSAMFFGGSPFATTLPLRLE